MEPTIVTFAVSDPEVLLALSDYPEGSARTHFLVTALKVGVLSLKAAQGTLDSATAPPRGDRLMEELDCLRGLWRYLKRPRLSSGLSQPTC